jgi:hypothetical protein
MVKATLSKYPDHPYVAMFPLLCGPAFDGLVDSIKTHGQQVPAVRYKGKIIDGRNRIRACSKLGIRPKITEWSPPDKGRDVETQILEFIVLINLHRRQLSESQRAMIAADYAEKIQNGRGTIVESTLQAAKLFDISKSTVEKAAMIKKWNPTMDKDVRKGNLSVTEGRAILAKIISRIPQRELDRRQIVGTFHGLIKKYGKYTEFDDVWAPMRKRLNKIAEAY